MKPHARDFLARLNRERLLDVKRMRPLPHQAAVWAAFDGLVLSDSSIESFPIETVAGSPDLGLYYEFRTPIPNDATDVLCWSGNEDEPEYRIERRPLSLRGNGPARFVSDLAAYKAGKSFQAGVLLAAELLVPGIIWDIIGMQYTICEPEFAYIADLLLSEGARVDTKPQLEILADDVKCTHGATIGQIDEQAIFYLCSRGIPRDTARAVLVYAFAAESLEQVRPEPLRQSLRETLFDLLPEGQRLREAM